MCLFKKKKNTPVIQAPVKKQPQQRFVQICLRVPVPSSTFSEEKQKFAEKTLILRLCPYQGNMDDVHSSGANERARYELTELADLFRGCGDPMIDDLIGDNFIAENANISLCNDNGVIYYKFKSTGYDVDDRRRPGKFRELKTTEKIYDERGQCIGSIAPIHIGM